MVTQAPPDGSTSQIWQLSPNGATFLLRNTGQGYLGANGQTITPPYTSGSNAVILSTANYSVPGENWTFVQVVPNITSPTTLTVAANMAASYVIQAGNNPTSFGATGMPPGYSVNTTTGLVSGPATTTGTYSMVVSATNSGGTGSATVTVTVQ